MNMRTRATDRFRRGAETPLSSAIWLHGVDAALARCGALLLDAGADPNVHGNGDSTVEDCDHSSPLYFALQRSIYIARSGDIIKHLLERMIRAPHVALTYSTINGVEQSILQFAFRQTGTLPLRIVKELLDVGCDTNETSVHLPDIPDGWSCLFLQKRRAFHPETSHELEVTRFLVKQRVNVFAKDGLDLTILIMSTRQRY